MDFLKGVYYGMLQFDTHSIVFAVILLVFVLSLIRAMFNVAMICVLGAVLMVGALDYTPQDIYYKVQSSTKAAKEFLRKSVEPILEENLEKADIQRYKDDTFEIVVGDVKMIGKEGETKVTVYINDEKLVVNMNDFSKKIQGQLYKIGNVPSKEEKKKD